MTKEEYVLLYEKYQSGNCSEEEIKQLAEYQDDFSLDDVYWDKIKLGNQQEVIQSIYFKLKDSIQGQQHRKPYRYQMAIAASIALFITLSCCYFYFKKDKAPQSASQLSNRIVPGSSKAVLTLGNGSKIILSNSSNGVLTTQGMAVVKKENDGKLVYKDSTLSAGQLVQYNSISIPRGGEYQLVLPDGTKVWLNAASSLKFPVAFTGKDRSVDLSGEAYFEVAKNKQKPFHVHVNSIEVEVLGTHFNINAYSKTVTTTLLEGSVKLKSQNKEVMLKPGQSGVLKAGGEFKIDTADIESAVGWKNGYFVFHDENIKSIMDKVSRWYDVDVEYRDNVEGKEFYGKVSRLGSITELLNNLEKTGIVHFKIESNDNSGKGRRIIVMP